MVLGGIQPCSLSDSPGKVAAVLFTQGCNFRCPFCHNGSLLARTGSVTLDEQELFDFLTNRKNMLGGLVITGGEPTEHVDLPEFIKKIRKRGFAVKLDTNGSRPEMIALLLEEGLVDYLAMDIKAPVDKYDILCGTDVDTRAVLQSISIIGASEVAHHFRTTHVKALLTESDLEEVVALVPQGSKHITQPFVPENAWKKEL